MQATLEQKLRAAEEYISSLEETFGNNLHVIEEQEQQIEFLNNKVAQLQQNNEALKQALERQQEQHEFQARLMNNEYQLKMDEQQHEMQEIAAMVQAKMRKEVEAVSLRLGQEVKAARAQLMQRDESSRRLLQEKNRLGDIISDLKNQVLQLEMQVTSLNEEKNTMSSKMALHEQELQGIRVCNSNWEEMLKEKLKEAQKERQTLEEEYGDYKLTVKEKLKKQKEDLARKIMQLSEEKESQLRQVAHEQKELRFKLQKALGEQRESAKELQLLREERMKLQGTLAKYKDHELKSSFEKNQKEYECLLKMFDQEKRDLKAQIEAAAQERKELKAELDSVNTRREEKEKAVERLRMDIRNKDIENVQLKKDIKRLQKELQAKTKGNDQPTSMQPPANNKQLEQVDNCQSKVYSEEMEEITSKYFEASAAKSPKHNNPNNFKQNREAQLMKQVSQLQMDLQEYKNIFKKLKDEMESIKKVTEEERNKEISLHRDRANVYWEKANDKEQQLNALKETNNELKTNYSELSQELKKYKESEAQWRAKEHESHQMKEKIAQLEKQVAQLEQEIDIITQDRDRMEQISSDLRSENHSLKEMLNASNLPYPDDNSFISQHDLSKSRQDLRPSIQIQPEPREEETVPFYQPERQKFPKKLHDLVREKKMLSVSGKRAAMEERPTEARLQQIHVGTDSQKEVLERIKVRNKTPPKIANYAEMKKDKQRRSHQLQTVSQKEVYQRLKSKQNSQALSPQRGVNYLQLRDLGAQ